MPLPPANHLEADLSAARAVARGIGRLFARNDIWCLPEMPLRGGRRADLMGIDAKGMLISAIEDDDPVLFFEPKRLYNGPFDGDPDKPAVPWSTHPKGEVPEGHYAIPLGKAEIVRSGSQLSIITYGTMVHVAQAAAAAMALDAEIIDIRSMVPLDTDTICSSVNKTGRCVVVHEATRFSGFGGELVALIQEECFWNLEAPIQRVTGWDTPYPHAFEWEYFPGQARVKAALKTVMEAA